MSAPASKRTKGRPARGSDDAGREKLLDGARLYLRSRGKREISRQDIARAAGVTPALTTYYFENKADLLLSATLPIIENAVRNATTVIESQQSYDDRLRSLIDLFIKFSSESGGILDVFIESALDLSDDRSQMLVLGAFDGLRVFFASGVQAGAWRAFDTTFFLFAMWGMCRLVGEKPAFPQVIRSDAATQKMWGEQSNNIFELLKVGIAPRPTSV